MRYLKKFNESATFLTDREEISGILGDLGVKRYEIEVDGTVNILNGGSIEMVFDGIDWTKIDREFDDTVIPIKFGRVEGYFLFKAENIYRPTLTSLEGFPQACRSFHIISAQITDLQGSPLMVDEDFECSFTSITSLKGCPKNIDVLYKMYCLRRSPSDAKPRQSLVTAAILLVCEGMTIGTTLS